MLDPEASGKTAHIFLDAAAVLHRDDSTANDVRDEMTALAMQRLTEDGSIRLMQHDESGAVTLDVARAGTGILAVIIACLDGWAGCCGVDRDELISEVRRIVEANLVE